MREKITAVSIVVNEFIKYLDSKKTDPRNWYFALLQVIRHNAAETLRKLDSLKSNRVNLNEIEQDKFFEYVARLHETIQSCLFHEKLEYKAASVAYSSIVLVKCTTLEKLDKNLNEIMGLSYKQAINPKKHWLGEEWKKIEAGLHRDTALGMVFEKMNKDNIDLCKTVLFSDKARIPVTSTTAKTKALTQHFNPYLKKELEVFEQKSEFALKLVSSLSPYKAKI